MRPALLLLWDADRQGPGCPGAQGRFTGNSWPGSKGSGWLQPDRPGRSIWIPLPMGEEETYRHRDQKAPSDYSGNAGNKESHPLKCQKSQNAPRSKSSLSCTQVLGCLSFVGQCVGCISPSLRAKQDC